jgi:hypothetical protein
MVGVAGGIAEEVWRSRLDPDCIDVFDCLSTDNFMSQTDWELCGCSSDEWSPKLARAAAQVVGLPVRELRSEWLKASRALMRDGVLLSPKATKELAGKVIAARQSAITKAPLPERQQRDQ